MAIMRRPRLVGLCPEDSRSRFLGVMHVGITGNVPVNSNSWDRIQDRLLEINCYGTSKSPMTSPSQLGVQFQSECSRAAGIVLF